MLVYLCRHGHAAAGDPDELRELTEEGRAQARELGERLADASPAPVAVVSSPFVRARQTAAAIARATDAELRVDERLAPGATLASLRAAVAGLDGPVATVGHQPDCSEIAVAVTGHDPGFPAGGMLELELDAEPR
ncbi:MAG TPA: histidine phosphatase family protein [Gaiella sp.]